MNFLKKIKKSPTQAIKAHYKIVALDESVSKGLMLQLEKLQDKKQQQDALNKFVVDEGIAGDDLLDLMYDLNKGGYFALQKPTVQGTPKSPSNPMLAKIKKGEIDEELGKMLSDNVDKTDFNQVVNYFKQNQKAYGKFMVESEKNGIGYYEKNFGTRIPITKEAFEQVTDDYLLNSILYSSVYSGLSMIKPDALEYAFNRFKNPVKAVMDHHGGVGDIFPMMVGEFKNKTGWNQKLKTWFKELSPKEQDEIEDSFWDEKHLGSIDDYK